jgi:HK97 family phage major capsid protein
MDARLDELSDEIKLHEKQEARESSSAAVAKAATRPETRSDPKAKRNAGGIRASAEYVRRRSELREDWQSRRWNVSTEIRNALSSDSRRPGRLLTASEEFSDRIIEVVDNQVFMRGLATNHARDQRAESLGIPTRAADVDDADWTSELATGTDDTGLVLGKRELKPHPLAKRIKISKKLIRG